MSDDVESTKVKSGFSAVVLIAAALLSLVLGYGAGAFTGQPILAALGLGLEESQEPELADEETSAAAMLFAPMPGVFDPEKDRFYAEVGEILVALPHRGSTRHLQLTVQLVGHDQDYMKTVENDVPAIRNGLLIFFNQQEFSKVESYEGREALRRETLQRVNEIIGATQEDRVADVYFTAYITQ
ncbi:MAG: flagellar basal body-associated FliL family protein [Pseudomonadota bacterium]|nr:flagellar basal body-associated FliL family protein [Pseudomonadota bacterium]